MIMVINKNRLGGNRNIKFEESCIYKTYFI